jgi:glutathione synthase
MAAQPERLIAAMREDLGDWVLKPMAGSFGEGVIRLASNETDRLRQVMSQQPGEYFVLQRLLPQIAQGETRTLIVGGQIIGSYLRVPTNALHANLAKEALTAKTELSATQLRLVTNLAADMLGQHIGFAAIDLVGDTLMEVNIANPGGLGTLQRLYDKDFDIDVIDAVAAFLQLQLA